MQSILIYNYVILHFSTHAKVVQKHIAMPILINLACHSGVKKEMENNLGSKNYQNIVNYEDDYVNEFTHGYEGILFFFYPFPPQPKLSVSKCPLLVI